MILKSSFILKQVLLIYCYNMKKNIAFKYACINLKIIFIEKITFKKSCFFTNIWYMLVNAKYIENCLLYITDK